MIITYNFEYFSIMSDNIESNFVFLSSTFNQISTAINNFKVDKNTFLMAYHVPIIAIIVYLSTLYLIKKHVENRKQAYDLRDFVSIYNLCVSFLSSALCYGLFYELMQRVSEYGIYDVTCDPEGKHTSGKLYVYYYINYLFKYLELIDTFLLFLRKRKVRFLHIYHHAATLYLCHSQLLSQSCVQFIIIQINLLVHVVMYYYYHLASTGRTVFWKKYLTSFQILQFIIAMIVCTSAIINNEMVDWGLKEGVECHGGRLGAYFGTSILFSYLVLFIKLYQELYKKKKQKN